jgi:serine/threonine-protein kinase
VDKRGDVWAFGVVLWEMLTGKRLFDGKTTSDVLAAVIRDEPDLSRVPAKVRPLLKRCLEKDPQRRLRDIGDAMGIVESTPEVAPLRSSRWAWIAAAAFAVSFCVAAGGWWRATRPAPLRPMLRVSVELSPGKTISTSRSSQVAVSPDGTRIAVTETDSTGRWRLATRLLEQREFVPLSGTDGAIAPFFSPDGQWIAFTAAADGKLKKIAVEGGAPVTLCDAPFGGMSWGDDNIIAGVTANGLSRIPSGGGAPVPMTKLDREKGETLHTNPQVLPGSRGVLFTTRFGIYGDAATAQNGLPLAGFERKNINRPVSAQWPPGLHAREQTIRRALCPQSAGGDGNSPACPG